MNDLTSRILKYSVLISVGVFITPYLVMIAGIILLFLGVLSTSPTLNLLRFRNIKMINKLDVERVDDPDKIYDIDWKKALSKIALGISLCIVSLIALYFGWRGLIYYF